MSGKTSFQGGQFSRESRFQGVHCPRDLIDPQLKKQQPNVQHYVQGIRENFPWVFFVVFLDSTGKKLRENNHRNIYGTRPVKLMRNILLMCKSNEKLYIFYYYNSVLRFPIKRFSVVLQTLQRKFLSNCKAISLRLQLRLCKEETIHLESQ